MANRTVPGAHHIHGADPQHLIEKIIRERIYDSIFWKERCFGLSAESIIDQAIALKYVGGLTGNQRPAPFLCLLLKLLQIQPEKEIIYAFLRNKDYKYLTILAAVYLRLVGTPLEIYISLEPLLLDYRKLRCRTPSGYLIIHIDEVVDDLLHEERIFNIILPRLVKRNILEDQKELQSYISPLLAEFSDSDESD